MLRLFIVEPLESFDSNVESDLDASNTTCPSHLGSSATYSARHGDARPAAPLEWSRGRASRHIRRGAPSKPLETPRARAPRGAALARPPDGGDRPQSLDRRRARRGARRRRARRGARARPDEPRRTPVARRRAASRACIAIAVNPEVDAVTIAAVGLDGDIVGARAHRGGPPRHAAPRRPSSSRAPCERWRSDALRRARIVAVGLAVPGLVRASDGLVRLRPAPRVGGCPDPRARRGGHGLPDLRRQRREPRRDRRAPLRRGPRRRRHGLPQRRRERHRRRPHRARDARSADPAATPASSGRTGRASRRRTTVARPAACSRTR